MKLKKTLSAILASVMVLSLSSVAFAAESDVSTPSTPNIDGSVSAPDIKAELPTFGTGTLTFDLYNQLGGGQQILSSDLTFKNASAIPVQIQLTGYTIKTDDTNAIVSLTDPAAVQAGTDKNLLLWLNEADKDTNGFYKKDAKGNFEYPAYVEATHKNYVFTGYTKSGDTDAPVDAKAKNLTFSKMARAKIAKMASGTITTTPVPGMILANRGECTLRFDGSMNKNATWKTDEKITIIPTFTFNPIALETTDIEDGEGFSKDAVLAEADVDLTNIKATAGAEFKIQMNKPAKTALTVADLAITAKMGSAVVSGYTILTPTVADDVVSFKVKGTTTALAGQELTITVKKTAFNPPLATDVTIVVPVKTVD